MLRRKVEYWVYEIYYHVRYYILPVLLNSDILLPSVWVDVVCNNDPFIDYRYLGRPGGEPDFPGFPFFNMIVKYSKFSI